MSSTISTTEKQSVAHEALNKLKLEEKPYRLVRSSSIEKIKRFNTFICSQQYYLLPALFNWLRSSQPSTTESAIYVLQLQKGPRAVLSSVILNFYQKFTKCLESTFLLTIAVYSACSLVLFQLVLALYMMFFAFLPYGFIFMVCCMVAIKYLCYKSFSLSLVDRGSSVKRDIKNK